MLAKIHAGALMGVDALLITIEVHVTPGVGYHLVGLPGSAIKESSQRIFSAITHHKYKLPNKRITVNMAPADLKKEGAAYDLPLAIGLLSATGQIASEHISQYMMMGELALDGKLRKIKGALPLTIMARQKGFKGFILPKENTKEAAIVNGIDVYAAENIQQVISFLQGNIEAIEKTLFDTRKAFQNPEKNYDLDFADVKGQTVVKRAIEVAAAGGHNMLMIGPPGSGKTMLAKRIPSILPPFTLQESLETTKIYSVVGKLTDEGLMTVRPFRAPHHTISGTALVGGGSYPQPGEISLAHNGVLFLDELPEFDRNALEVLRQPLEDREITISRARQTLTYPSSFMLIASMNPSPSGNYYDPTDPSSSTLKETQRYMSKLSEPLLDRIDMQIEVAPVPFEELQAKPQGEPGKEIKKRVIAARECQKKRFKDRTEIHYNSQMGPKEIELFCPMTMESKALLKVAMEKLKLSARGYSGILKVARTIADLDNSETLESHHISEAIQTRSLDKQKWFQ